jgi:hypothetical protein
MARLARSQTGHRVTVSSCPGGQSASRRAAFTISPPSPPNPTRYCRRLVVNRFVRATCATAEARSGALTGRRPESSKEERLGSETDRRSVAREAELEALRPSCGGDPLARTPVRVRDHRQMSPGHTLDRSLAIGHRLLKCNVANFRVRREAASRSSGRRRSDSVCGNAASDSRVLAAAGRPGRTRPPPRRLPV